MLKHALAAWLYAFMALAAQAQKYTAESASQMYLLYAHRCEFDEAMPYRDYLAELTPDALARQLPGDSDRKAVFINLYNAEVQYQLRADTMLYHRRGQFFKRKSITLAGQKLSLDDLEHGLLRRSRWKYGQGYIGKLVTSRFERRLRLSKRDPRIHFALNCGARSCPGIAFYGVLSIEEQLNRAEEGFIKLCAQCSPGSGAGSRPHCEVSRLFKWFKSDFGGNQGIRKLLEKHQMMQVGAQPKLRFAPYNWQMDLENEFVFKGPPEPEEDEKPVNGPE